MSTHVDEIHRLVECVIDELVRPTSDVDEPDGERLELVAGRGVCLTQQRDIELATYLDALRDGQRDVRIQLVCQPDPVLRCRQRKRLRRQGVREYGPMSQIRRICGGHRLAPITPLRADVDFSSIQMDREMSDRNKE